LGENILIAPVIVENATSRDIYLPAGLWRDENHHELPPITGRKWLKQYSAGLEVLPWFTKIGEQPDPQSSNSIRLVSSTVCTLASALIIYLFL